MCENGQGHMIFNTTARRKFVHDHDALVQGFMQDATALSVAILSKKQHELGITGAVGEIGVHHGLFFFAIVAAARLCEHMIAIDIFGDQGKNIDKSGHGDYTIFAKHAEQFNLTAKVVQQGQSPTLSTRALQRTLGPRTIAAFASTSSEVSPQTLCAATGYTGVRLFSIDGGHTADIVHHDLSLLNCLLVDGGLLCA